MTAANLDLTPVDHTHPIVNGRVLLPAMSFTACIAGTRAVYRCVGVMRLSASGEPFVPAVDRRGNSRCVAVASIVNVKRKAAS